MCAFFCCSLSFLLLTLCTTRLETYSRSVQFCLRTQGFAILRSIELVRHTLTRRKISLFIKIYYSKSFWYEIAVLSLLSSFFFVLQPVSPDLILIKIFCKTCNATVTNADAIRSGEKGWNNKEKISQDTRKNGQTYRYSTYEQWTFQQQHRINVLLDCVRSEFITYTFHNGLAIISMANRNRKEKLTKCIKLIRKTSQENIWWFFSRRLVILLCRLVIVLMWPVYNCAKH